MSLKRSAPWFGNRCRNRILTTSQGETWKVVEKIVERIGHDPFWMSDPREVVGVFRCAPVDVAHSSRRAVAKIRLQ